MKFGETDTLLVENSNATNYELRSPVTGETCELNPKNTLIFDASDEKLFAHQIYSSIVANAPFTAIMPRIRRECPNCGIKIVSYIRVKEHGIIIFSCECGHSWQSS